VLARSDVSGFSVTGSEGHTFANQSLFQTPLGAFSPQRGYVLVDASLDGVPFQFVSTHLDETHSSAQALEAAEILAELNTNCEPQLVVGDFNANPTQSPFTYAEMVSAGFTDVAAAPGETGPTCCQPSDLDNPLSELTNRCYYVFERGFSSLDEALLVETIRHSKICNHFGHPTMPGWSRSSTSRPWLARCPNRAAPRSSPWRHSCSPR
jgi:hypothetical protein